MSERIDPTDPVAALASLYTAERADGSAIYSTSIQVLASMLIFAGLGATLLTTEFTKEHPIAFACMPIVAWGLACYTVVVNALMTVRVLSISVLERQLLAIAQTHPSVSFEHAMASDAGDWISRVRRQTMTPAIATYAAFTSALASVAGVTFFILLVTAARIETWQTVLFGIGYGGIFCFVLWGYVYVFSGRLETAWLQSPAPAAP